MPQTDAAPGGRTEFLGVDFDPLDMDAAAAWIAARGADSAYAYVATPNVDHMVRLEHASEEVRKAYRAADLLLCDSRVLARLALWAGVGLPVVPGSDLVARLFARVLAAGDRICVIGGSAETVERLRSLHPLLDIRHHDAAPGLATNPAARAEAADFAIAAAARVTFLAVGSPQQELIAHELAKSGTARGTALCIGASIDFIVGAQTRAPRAVQEAGMEWAWRLAQNPRRLARRYLIDGPAIFAMVWRWRRR